VLSFNADIAHDDGLIASSVSRRDSITYEQAVAKVTSIVETMRRQIASDKELVMPGIGVFKLTDEQLLMFEPADTSVVSLSTLSLPTVSLMPIRDVNKSQNSTDDSSQNATYLPFNRNWLKWVASLAIFVCLGAILSTPIAIPDAAQASLSTPSISFSKADNDQFETFELSDANRHGVLSIVIPRDSDAVAIVDTVKAQVPMISATHSIDALAATDNYYVVVASLASRPLAQEYIAHSEIPMSILEKDGKYRVYVATGRTYVQAMSLAKAIQNGQYPDAWVCPR
jgi:hypothetical protein